MPAPHATYPCRHMPIPIYMLHMPLPLQHAAREEWTAAHRISRSELVRDRVAPHMSQVRASARHRCVPQRSLAALPSSVTALGGPHSRDASSSPARGTHCHRYRYPCPHRSARDRSSTPETIACGAREESRCRRLAQVWMRPSSPLWRPYRASSNVALRTARRCLGCTRRGPEPTR